MEILIFLQKRKRTSTVHQIEFLNPGAFYRETLSHVTRWGVYRFYIACMDRFKAAIF